MATSQTDICNRALQKLGAKRINAITDQSVAARACQTCYDILRVDELRSHPWNFAIQRFQLPASAVPPAFGPTNSFPLPTGGLKLLPPDSMLNVNDRDWKVESGMVFTNDPAPLNVRCVMNITDTTKFDSCFVEALASLMAMEMCEQLTQSNTKYANVERAYKAAIGKAKRTNAMENVPQMPADDDWVTARVNGGSNAFGSGGWPFFS